MPTFTWVFENQQIASEVVTQPTCYKRAESIIQADEKCPQQGDLDSSQVIHLYYLDLIYWAINFCAVPHKNFKL